MKKLTTDEFLNDWPKENSVDAIKQIREALEFYNRIGKNCHEAALVNDRGEIASKALTALSQLEVIAETHYNSINSVSPAALEAQQPVSELVKDIDLAWEYMNSLEGKYFSDGDIMDLLMKCKAAISTTVIESINREK